MSLMRPHWTPTSFADAVAQVAARQVQESHYFEAKRLIEDNPRGTSKIGKALSAFSTDGGTFVIGLVENDRTGTVETVCPVPLKGLQERVSQVALRCDPPVVLPEMIELRENPGDPDGVLLVHILPSPDAPHMYDGRFYGRDQRCSYPLSRPEVDRLLQLRARRADMSADELDRFLAVWPVASKPSLVVTMLPAPTPANDLMLMRFMGNRYGRWLRDLIQPTGLRLHRARCVRTATGVRAEENLDVGQVDASHEASVLEIDRDGTIRFGTDGIGRDFYDPDGTKLYTQLRWREINSRVGNLVDMAKNIFGQVGAEYGLRVAVQVNAINGLHPEPLFYEGPDWTMQSEAECDGYEESPYPAHSYRRASEWHPLEVPGDHRHLLDRLFAPLYNSMGLPPYLEHPQFRRLPEKPFGVRSGCRVGGGDLDPSESAGHG